GIGITEGVATYQDSTAYINMYVDNVNYSGYQKIYGVSNFGSNSISGGTGWGGNWSFTGNASIVSSGTPNGTYHLQLTSNNGVASRAANLSGVTTARLAFNWKANSFEAGETAVVEIYDGTSWINVLTISD